MTNIRSINVKYGHSGIILSGLKFITFTYVYINTCNIYFEYNIQRYCMYMNYKYIYFIFFKTFIIFYFLLLILLLSQFVFIFLLPEKTFNMFSLLVRENFPLYLFIFQF